MTPQEVGKIIQNKLRSKHLTWIMRVKHLVGCILFVVGLGHGVHSFSHWSTGRYCACREGNNSRCRHQYTLNTHKS